MERPKLHRLGSLHNALRPRGIKGSAHLAEVLFGVETSTLSEYQAIRLAPDTTTPDDELTAAAHGFGLSQGMPIVRKCCGGLLAPILHMSAGSRGVASGEHRPSRGDFGGGVLAVSQWRIILSRS